MKAVRLYFRFFEMQLKSMMQHKASFFFTMLGQFLVSFNVFLGVYFMMTRFHEVSGFNYPEVLGFPRLSSCWLTEWRKAAFSGHRCGCSRWFS